MKINLQGRNLELTDTVKDYVSKRITNLEKLISSIEAEKGEARANFEIVKTTNRHKTGDVFSASCQINVGGNEFYGKSEDEDLFKAIDTLKETLYREINRDKNRRHTLIVRGARSVKKMLKGLSDRNPFTSKY